MASRLIGSPRRIEHAQIARFGSFHGGFTFDDEDRLPALIGFEGEFDRE
jgi:hypothetical protein